MQRIAFLLILFSAFAVKVGAQVKVNYNDNDIDHIVFVDSGGGMGGYDWDDYEVVHENNKWLSYHTGKHSQRIGGILGPEREDSTDHRLIKTIAEDSIYSFLNAISTIKPTFDPSKLGYTVESITRQINEKYFSHNINRAKAFDAFFDTPEKLYQILAATQKDGMLDVTYSHSIYIIKKSGDTIKIISSAKTVLSLPWEINKQKTYDANISRFFAYATNRVERLNDAALIANFYFITDYFYGKEAFNFSYWMKTEPENMKLLQKYYTIVDVTRGGPGKLLYKANNHIASNGGDISDKKQLQQFIKFTTDTLRPLLNSRPFMIDSCSKSNTCKVVFDYTSSGSSKLFPIAYMSVLNSQLKKYYKTALYRFTILDRSNTEEDEWLVLPNKTFLLVTYFGDFVTGVAPKNLTGDGKDSPKVALKVFSRNGKLLRTYDKKDIEFDNTKRYAPVQER